MKRFRFPLRPVAVLRSHQELRAREAFGAAVRALAESEEALRAARARLHAFEVALAAGRAGRFSAQDEAQALVAYRRECAAEAEAERAVAAARATLHQRRADYLQAHRNVEIVSRLEQKARAAHRAETAREEQAEFDDFASRRFLKRGTPFSS